jgi:DNA mismatch endonuclease, patch repair protein
VADFLSKKERSARMALIKSKNTKPELRMASLLRKAKIKFRRHRSSIPGKPDFMLLGSRVLVFVDGKFWHGKDFEKWEHKLKPFWRDKILANMNRDKKTNLTLREMGWSVVRLWEDEVCKREKECVSRISQALQNSARVGQSVTERPSS